MGLAWPNRVGLHSRIFLPVCRNGGLAELELDVEEAFVLDYEVRNLIVAEYGVLDQRGLVSLSGIFSAIRVAEFPATVTPRVFAEVFPAPQEAGAVEVTFSGSSCGNPPAPVRVLMDASPPEQKGMAVFAQTPVQLTGHGDLVITVALDTGAQATRTILVQLIEQEG